MLKIATFSGLEDPSKGCGVLYIIIYTLTKDVEEKHVIIIFDH